MKKIIMILLASACLQIAAQKHVVLAPMEFICKPLRIVWHCAKLGIAYPQLDYFRRCIRNYPYILSGQIKLTKPQNAQMHIAVAGIGGTSSLYGGFMGLKKELWDRKKQS